MARDSRREGSGGDDSRAANDAAREPEKAPNRTEGGRTVGALDTPVSNQASADGPRHSGTESPSGGPDNELVDTPFAAGDEEWESELAAWDAAIPIVTRPGQIEPVVPAAKVTLRTASSGAVPDEENPFKDTPTTLVSPVDRFDLEDLPEMVSATTFDEGVTPASGSYAALVATDQSAPTLFEREPPFEEAPQLGEESLRETTEATWTGDLSRLIERARRSKATCSAPAPEYWRTLAEVVAEERALVAAAEHSAPSDPTARDAPVEHRALGLALTAARMAELLGADDEVRTHLRAALTIAPHTPAAHRAILVSAERAQRCENPEASASLLSLALTPHPDQPYYRALAVEWSANGNTDNAQGAWESAAGSALDAIPEGLARHLAAAEHAWKDPGRAAGILARAAEEAGHGLGSALSNLAAELHERAGDTQAAADQRLAAARLDLQGRSFSLAQLRDLARMDSPAVLSPLDELVDRLPPSPLRVAVARWGASCARRAGLPARAWRFLSEGGGTANGGSEPSGESRAALARDRLDVIAAAASTGAAPGTATELASVMSEVRQTFAAITVEREKRAGTRRETAPALLAPISSTVATVLALRACELAVRGLADAAFALDAVDLALGSDDGAPHGEASPGSSALALAPAIERLLHGPLAIPPVDGDAPAQALSALTSLRLRAIRLWRRTDRLRWVSASVTLADALGTRSDEAVAALEEIDRRHDSTINFWTLAARATHSGDFDRAAALLDAGVARAPWRDSSFSAALTELATERAARSSLPAAIARFNSGRARPSSEDRPRWTQARLLRALADRDLWAEYVEQEIVAERAQSLRGRAHERARRAALLLEPVFWPAAEGEGDDVPSLVAAALDASPMDPVAFALALAGRPDPATLVDRLLAGAGEGTGRLWQLFAGLAAGMGGDVARAFALAAELAEPSAQSVEQQGAGPRPLGEAARASARRLAWAAFDPDERSRVLRSFGDDVGPINWFVPAPEPANRFDRTSRLLAAAWAQRWEDVVEALRTAPPHEEPAGVDSLTLAALIDEGRGGGECAQRLWAEAYRAASASSNDRAGAVDAPVLWNTADLSAVTAGNDDELASALDRLAQAAAEEGDERSAALFLLEASVASAEAADDETRASRLHSATRHDPRSAPAAIAWRRWLTLHGRPVEAAHASAAEAEALVDPELRLAALLRAADLLVPDRDLRGDAKDSGGSAAVDVKAATLATAFLERATKLAPRNNDVFTRLRSLYEATHRHGDLVRLLAKRIRVTANPFEVTALHLARADLLAGPLADQAAARAELQSILQKEPHHARALARLADLEVESGNDAAAADLLVRRAFVERSPERLRELFLRLGRIYTQRLPDAKRAVGAYARVLQLDTNNREALDELSRLYVGLGETKSAIAITERLTQLEAAPQLRSRYYLRLGQLCERAADTRAANIYFRKAAEDAPRDPEVLGELVRHLDKARDSAGKRAYLERAATDLRAAVLAQPTDRDAVEALVAVLRWRGRAAAAAAAAELAAFVTAELENAKGRVEGEGTQRADTVAHIVLPAWAVPPAKGRSLAALANPSIDEQTFPSSVLPSVRHLFGLLGPVLVDGRPELARYGVGRGDRVAPGHSPRDVFDAVAAELAAGPFELYVAAAPDSGLAMTFAVAPGKPPAIVVGASLLKMGASGVRFAAAHTLRLVATHLDGALAGSERDLALWMGGIIRQFVPDYRLPEIEDAALSERAVRVGRMLPRRMRQQVMPFAMESSGPLDVAALRAGIRDAANRVGLLACGSLAVSLRVLLGSIESRDEGRSGEGRPKSRTSTDAASADTGAPRVGSLTTSAEVQALLQFALSDDYDDLVRALG